MSKEKSLKMVRITNDAHKKLSILAALSEESLQDCLSTLIEQAYQAIQNKHKI